MGAVPNQNHDDHELIIKLLEQNAKSQDSVNDKMFKLQKRTLIVAVLTLIATIVGIVIQFIK